MAMRTIIVSFQIFSVSAQRGKRDRRRPSLPLACFPRTLNRNRILKLLALDLETALPCPPLMANGEYQPMTSQPTRTLVSTSPTGCSKSVPQPARCPFYLPSFSKNDESLRKCKRSPLLLKAKQHRCFFFFAAAAKACSVRERPNQCC